MRKYKNLGKGMLLIPDADLKLAPGEAFTTEAPTKQVLLAIKKGMLALEDPEAVANDLRGSNSGEKELPQTASNPSNQNKAGGPRGRFRTGKT